MMMAMVRSRLASGGFGPAAGEVCALAVAATSHSALPSAMIVFSMFIGLVKATASETRPSRFQSAVSFPFEIVAGETCLAGAWPC